MAGSSASGSPEQGHAARRTPRFDVVWSRGEDRVVRLLGAVEVAAGEQFVGGGQLGVVGYGVGVAHPLVAAAPGTWDGSAMTWLRKSRTCVSGSAP